MSRKSLHHHNRRLLAAAVAACFAAAPAWSLPTTPTVVNGTATFNQVGQVLSVTNSNNAIINWQKFGIAAGEVTKFIQPAASSAVLNRVVGGDLSAIYGSLQSNGRVWLVNPAGILVGPGATIDTAAFVASTLAMRDADFLAGRLTFSATSSEGGNVINQGTITTPTGGSVYLIGAHVSNEGIINTRKGEVILASGQTVNLVDTATPGLKVEITGAEGNTTNLGTIAAEAGRIGMVGVIVRNTGTLNASSAVEEGGRVFLKASQDTYVDGSGRIVATGTKGGRVEVLGNRVAVMDTANIDASGANGGGRVMVGGDFQGKNPDIQNAQITYLGPDAQIKANAQNVGDGGTVIIWADDTTRAYGSIEARGGNNGGNGGFVEVSGKHFLDYQGSADRSAPKGKAGSLLLDPDELCISASYGGPCTSAITWSTIESNLYGGPVALTTSGAGGNIVIVDGWTFGYIDNDLSLLARGDIATNGNYVAKLGGTGGMLLVAGWDGNTTVPDTTGTVGSITGNGIFVTSGGTFTAKAADSITLGMINTIGSGGATNDSGDITLQAGGSITTGNLLSVGAEGYGYAGGNGGSISVQAGSFISTGAIDSRGGYSWGYNVGGGTGGAINLVAGTTISTNSITSSGGDGGEGGAGGKAGNITLKAGGNISVAGGVFANGGAGGYGYFGGNGGHGGAGGYVEINSASGNIQTGEISVSGGNGANAGYSYYGSYIGGNGGDAGSVSVIAAGSSEILGDIYARGGSGGSGYTSGIGGLGGNVSLQVGNAAGSVFGYSIDVSGGLGSMGGYIGIATGGNLSTAGITIGGTPTGIGLYAGGILTVNSAISLPWTDLGLIGGTVNIQAPLSGYNVAVVGNSVSITNDIDATNYLGVVSFGNLAISGGAWLTAGSSVVLASNNISLSGGSAVWAWGDAYLLTPMETGSITMTGNSAVRTYYGDVILDTNQLDFNYSGIVAGHDIRATVSGDAKFNDNAGMIAGNDINLTMTGAESTIYLNEMAGLIPSFLLANHTSFPPNTIYLNYLARASGGLIVDGMSIGNASTYVTVPGSSGFYVTGFETPALTGAGLVVTYATAPNDLCTIMPDLCRPPTTATTAVDACAMDPKLCTPPPTSGLGEAGDWDDQTAGGGEDEFGDDGKGGKGGQRRVRMCRS